MGYSTEFKGELRFTSEMTAKQLARIKCICGEDCREHPEWGAEHLTYMDVELTDDFSGLCWSGSEKTYDLCEKVNLLTSLMRIEWPDFSLTGELQAQGEDFDDRWVLKINDAGIAERKEVVISGQTIECPHCERKFILEAQSA